MAALPLAEAPVFYAPAIGYYVVTRYADVEAVFIRRKLQQRADHERAIKA